MAKKIIESIKNFFNQAESELNSLRDKIGATNAEIEILENRPIDLPTAQGRLREGIAEIGRRFAEVRFKSIAFMNQAEHGNSLVWNFKYVDPFEFACWLTPDLVEEKMQGVLSEFLEQNPGVDPAERAKKLEELGAILRKLEIDEESLIREAGQIGMAVRRRPDASPEVVLGA